MHFILFLALVPSLCVFSLEIPSQPESPVGGPFRNQQFLTGFDNAQQQLSTANANNEINSESPGLSAQLMDDKKSTSSVTRQQFRVCSSMTILPLHDYGSCSRTIHRLAGAVCRGAGNGNGGNLGVNSLSFGGRSRRSSTGSAGGVEASGEEELEDALLEFTNGNRNHNHPQNGFWAQEQKQQKRFYGNQQQQQQQQQPQFQQTQQQQPAMYGGHQGGLISVGHHEQVKKELIRKCCKYSNVCQVEFVVENLSDSCNGHSHQQQQQQKEQPLHVAKARA